MTKPRTHKPSANGTQGAKWIRREKRLAIYLRDGMACCYCGAAVEDGASLTLDHLKPRSKGGSHEASNLVTCCLKCNSSRGDRPVRTFARAVAEYLDHGIQASDIVAHVEACRRRVIDVGAAKDLIARRGGWAAALSPARGGR
uniref:Putative homing endonuclease n=1 Tax=viral metagenome TaxID=1070528 RepID=A0A6M3MCH7_9ZZZZ